MMSPLESISKKRKQPQGGAMAKRARMLMDDEAEEVSDDDLTPDEGDADEDMDDSSSDDDIDDLEAVSVTTHRWN